ncbi:HotDog domain-containing protein [Schizophyllum fasciatum]
MTDSYCEIDLPFSAEPKLVDRYTNASGGIRTGKLMEHLDSIAGSIAYKHMLGPSATSVGPIEQAGFYLVTASVDRCARRSVPHPPPTDPPHSLDMLGRLDPARDLRLSGMVIYTGKSSMEVAVKMASVGGGKGGKDETVLIGRFSMVCLSAETNRATRVNPLVRATAEEERLHAMGEDIKNRRRTIASQSLDRVPPTKAEADALHQLYLKHGDPEYEPRMHDCVWMSDSRLEKTQLMFPQVRNLHNKVFGGYLMRLAYELGFASASLFCRGPIRFFSLDGISFAKPVPIGSILRLKSWVLHSAATPEHPVLVHVGVTANVVDVRTGKEETTNEFRFTWSREDGEPLNRTVVPRTYGEAMLWLEGGRALQTGLEIRESRERKSAAA